MFYSFYVAMLEDPETYNINYAIVIYIYCIMTNKAFQSPESFIYCGFADAPPEAQSTDSEDRPKSEELSSPADPCSFEEEVQLKSPLPAQPEPTRPPVPPTQPYYLNGELQKHISPSDFIKIFYFLRCYNIAIMHIIWTILH